jgi:hypothetical protein
VKGGGQGGRSFYEGKYVHSLVLKGGLVSALSRVTMLILQGEEEEKGGNSSYLEDPVDN